MYPSFKANVGDTCDRCGETWGECNNTEGHVYHLCKVPWQTAPQPKYAVYVLSMNTGYHYRAPQASWYADKAVAEEQMKAFQAEYPDRDYRVQCDRDRRQA